MLRKHYLLVAKCLRNTSMSKTARIQFCRNFLKALCTEYPMTDKAAFMSMALGEIVRDDKVGYLMEEYDEALKPKV